MTIFPPEWIPTFVVAGIIALVAFFLMFLDWRDDRRKKKTGSPPKEA